MLKKMKQRDYWIAAALLYLLLVAGSFIRFGQVEISMQSTGACAEYAYGSRAHIENIYVNSIRVSNADVGITDSDSDFGFWIEAGKTATIHVPMFSHVQVVFERTEDSGYLVAQCRNQSRTYNLYGVGESVSWHPTVTPLWMWMLVAILVVLVYVGLLILVHKVRFFGRLSSIVWIFLTAVVSRMYWGKFFPKIFYISPDTFSYEEFFTSLGYYLDFRTPLYPIIIKIAKMITGDLGTARVMVVVLQSLLGLLSVFLFYAIVIRLTRKVVANALTVVFANFPMLIFYEHEILTESIGVFLFILLVYLVQHYLERASVLTAVEIALVLMLNIMQRPANIYLLPILAVFFVAYGFFEGKVKKGALSLAALLIPLVAVMVICSVNYASHGRFELSFVSTIYNDGWSIEENNMFYGSGNLEIEDAVTHLKVTAGDNQWNYINDVLDRFGSTSYAAFIKSAKAANQKEFFVYVADKWLDDSGMLFIENNLSSNREFWVNEDPVMVWNHGMHLEKILNYLCCPFNYGQVIIVAVVGLFLGIAEWIRKRRAPWLELGLYAIVFSSIFVSFWNGTGDYQRLTINILPVLYMILAIWVEKISSSRYDGVTKTTENEGCL